MTRAVFSFLAVVLTVSTGVMGARAESGFPDYRRINETFASEILLVDYARLSDETGNQQTRWQRACLEPSTAKIEVLQNAFHRTSDAWAAVFNWNFGPVTLLLRRDRFYHWPERRNGISRALSGLLHSQNPDRLEPSVFSQTSVAVQGLPALERLLFENTDVRRDAWACQVGLAIARNLHTIASGTVRDWRDDVMGYIRRGEPHPVYFGQPEEVLNALFTGILTGYAIIRDQKLLPVLGDSMENAGPNLVEGRRSGRFIRTLRLNITALFRADEVLARYIPRNAQDAQESLAQKKAGIRALLNQIAPLETAVYEPDQRVVYEMLMDRLTDYRNHVARLFTRYLGARAGFNSLDGD